MSDINNQAYNAEYVEYDPTAEQRQSSFTPISDGTRSYRMTLGSKGVELRTSKAGNPYVQAHVVGEVVNPGGSDNGKKVSFWLNEFGRSDSEGKRQPSDLHQICFAAGINVPARTARGEFKDLVSQALGVQPIMKVYTRWQIQQQDAEGKRKTVVKGMKSFQQLPDGSYNPTYTFPDGSTAEADLGVFIEAPTQAGGATS